MTPCNSDTHPSFVAIHADPDECPACRMVLDTINAGNLKHAYGSAQLVVRLLAGMVSPGEPVDLDGTGKVPEGPEKSPADSPPSSTTLKAHAADVEARLPHDVVSGVRALDSRYPDADIDVTSWRGRVQAAGAYLGALRVAEADRHELAHPPPDPSNAFVGSEPTPAIEAPTIEDADARLF